MRLAPLAALVTLASLIAPTAAADPTHDAEVGLSSWTEGTLRTTQVWEGDDARSLRQSLDVLFGDADGTVTAEEVEAVEAASEKDMMDKELPLLAVDGAQAVVTSADVELADAEGAIDSGETVEITHDVTFSVTDSGAAERRVALSPYWNGTLSFTAPAGWVVTEVEGLDGAQPNGANVTGGVVADREVALVVAEPAPEPQPADTDTNTTAGDGTADEEPQEASPPEGDAVVWDPPEDEGGFDVPAPGLVAALAVVAGAALLALGRRR